MVLSGLLTDVGCIVVGPAATAQSALRLIEHEPIDCAILDVKLVDGTSLPVAEALASRSIRFVLATGMPAKGSTLRTTGRHSFRCSTGLS